MRIVQVGVPHSQVDIELATTGLLAGLKLTERARDVDHLIVGNFIAKKVRLHTLSQEGYLRAGQLCFHGTQNRRGVSILSF
jgi:hypothetical protein